MFRRGLIILKNYGINGAGLRNISITSTNHLKEIKVEQEKDSLVIKGEYLESNRKKNLLPIVTECSKDGRQFCPQCTLGLDIKHTDVLILSQYVRSDGCMLPKMVTKLCKRQQKRITYLVAMAQKAGLMSNLTPPTSKKDPAKRFGFKKFNHYFDENTIKCR